MVYDEFDSTKANQMPLFKRRRRLALDFPKNRTLKLEEIPISIRNSRSFMPKSRRALSSAT